MYDILYRVMVRGELPGRWYLILPFIIILIALYLIIFTNAIFTPIILQVYAIWIMSIRIIVRRNMKKRDDYSDQSSVKPIHKKFE